ncbi:unnamed protein product, partial [Iphiclides podalirius]
MRPEEAALADYTAEDAQRARFEHRAPHSSDDRHNGPRLNQGCEGYRPGVTNYYRPKTVFENYMTVGVLVRMVFSQQRPLHG